MTAFSFHYPAHRTVLTNDAVTRTTLLVNSFECCPVVNHKNYSKSTREYLTTKNQITYGLNEQSL